MKNLFLVPTTQPTRLHLDNKLFLSPNYQNSKTINSIVEGRNIYITSNVEINKDTKTCWCVDTSCNELVLHQGVLPSYHYKHYKKIIMATDKSINVLCGCGKDCGAKESGVQAIDDTFLEWFVQNPSCEEVETFIDTMGCTLENCDANPCINYKIIIPKKEPKYPIGGYTPGNYYCNCISCNVQFQGDKRACQCKSCAIKTTKEEPKQETLEEAAERINYFLLNGRTPFNNGFKEGAKWQQKRSFSEEEVLELLNDCRGENPIDVSKWFKQFKK